VKAVPHRPTHKVGSSLVPKGDAGKMHGRRRMGGELAGARRRTSNRVPEKPSALGSSVNNRLYKRCHKADAS
jgi:hypothetical protein